MPPVDRLPIRGREQGPSCLNDVNGNEASQGPASSYPAKRAHTDCRSRSATGNRVFFVREEVKSIPFLAILALLAAMTDTEWSVAGMPYSGSRPSSAQKATLSRIQRKVGVKKARQPGYTRRGFCDLTGV